MGTLDQAEEQRVSLAHINQLRMLCEAANIDSVSDYIDHLRALLLLTQWESPSTISSLLGRIRAHGYWDSLQLPHALIALISRVIGAPTEPIELLTPLGEKGSHMLEQCVPRPLLSLELAIVTACVALYEENSELLSSVVQLALWHSRLFDYHGKPFHGLWSEAESSDAHRFSAYAHKLFMLCELAGDEQWPPLVDSCRRQYENGLKEYDYFLFSLLDKLMTRKALSIEMPSDELDRYTLLTKVDPDISVAYTACGVRNGLGAIHKKAVQIAAFGPHFYPLGVSSRFGFFRPASLGRASFPDVSCSESSISGWAPLLDPTCAEPQPGKSWMHFALSATGGAAHIATMFVKEEHISLSFVFFVIAERVIVGDQTLYPASLKKYEGEAQPLSCNDELTITPHHDGRMQVIPLAGGAHFWGATFLVAYPITSEQTRYAFSIE